MTPPHFKIKNKSLENPLWTYCVQLPLLCILKIYSIFQSLSVSYSLISMKKLFSLSPHIWECIVQKSVSPVQTVFTKVMFITILNVSAISCTLLSYCHLAKLNYFFKNIGSWGLPLQALSRYLEKLCSSLLHSAAFKS